MKNVLQETYLNYLSDLPEAKQWQVANQVAAFTKFSEEEASKLAPIYIQELAMDDTALVAMNGGDFAGFIRRKVLIPSETPRIGYQQVGGLVVAKQFRGRGIGSLLVTEMTFDVLSSGNKPFAFCNGDSASLFQRAGYVPIADRELPDGVKSMFGNQPMMYDF
jgi:predicted N-acetyltransferase YhbS